MPPEQSPPPNRPAAGDAGPVKITYGDRKSGCAIAFRAKQPPGEGANLVTFKPVPGDAGGRPKWNMKAKYVTLPDAGGEHAEQAIIRLIEGGACKSISLGDCVKWVYSERAPCFGRLDNACADSLRRLLSAQAGAEGAPRVEVFYSFDAGDEAEAEIEREISRRRQSGEARTLVSTDKGRDAREVETRQEFYEGQLDEDIEYFRKASGG
jgi:hypothetical protein